MAKRKEGCKVVFVEAPLELVERLRAVAKLNHRSITGEAVVAFERHVQAEEAARSSADQLVVEPIGSKRKGKKGGDK